MKADYAVDYLKANPSGSRYLSLSRKKLLNLNNTSPKRLVQKQMKIMSKIMQDSNMTSCSLLRWARQCKPTTLRWSPSRKKNVHAELCMPMEIYAKLLVNLPFQLSEKMIIYCLAKSSEAFIAFDKCLQGPWPAYPSASHLPPSFRFRMFYLVGALDKKKGPKTGPVLLFITYAIGCSMRKSPFGRLRCARLRDLFHISFGSCTHGTAYWWVLAQMQGVSPTAYQCVSRA